MPELSPVTTWEPPAPRDDAFGVLFRAHAQGLVRLAYVLLEDREAAGASLEAAGHPLEYVYDPPLDDYAGDEFVDPSPAPDAARWWVTHALPVDPLLADTALAALAGPGLLSPPHRTV